MNGKIINLRCPNRHEKQGIDLAIPGLIVKHVIHYATAAPKILLDCFERKKKRHNSRIKSYI